jgi:hypothetical protein
MSVGQPHLALVRQAVLQMLDRTDEGNDSMLRLVVAAGMVGLVLGFFLFRLPAVITASASLFWACIGMSLAAQWTVLGSVGLAFAGVTILQCGYVAGLFAVSVWGGAKAPDPILRSARIDQWKT